MKGFIFTLDIIIGIVVVLFLIFSLTYLEYESVLPQKRYQRLTYLADDTMDILSNLKIQDIEDDPVINDLISQNIIKENDLNKSALDMITSFWYAGNESIAENISQAILQGITDFCVNISIQTETIYSSCNTSAEKNIAVSSRIETGYEVGKPTFGYTARAFLTSIKGKRTSAYAYFGGYVGDGNITRNLELPGDVSVSSVTMELDAGGTFDLYINENFSGSYTPSSGDMSADRWTVCNTTTNPSYCSFFRGGNNTVAINFTQSANYIGGGYLRVVYDTSQLSSLQSANQSIYWLPGIQGIINLYSSFYVPGDLNEMSAYLHLKNNYPTFFSIGNVTIFNTSETLEQNLTIADSNLSAVLDYQLLSRNTIPLRLGTEAFQTVGVGNGDSILITDVSGSMEWCSNVPFGEHPYTKFQWKTWWEDDQLIGSWRWHRVAECPDKAPRNIEVAQEANILFVDTVLNTSGNRIGMVDYTGSYWAYNYRQRRWFIKWPDHIAGTEDLTDDGNTLQDHIDNTETWWGTCTCCGINRAVSFLDSQSNTSRYRSMVVMSDGDANIRCSQQGTGNAKQDAIQAGQDACANNITVYTVGYGVGADQDTLKQIACDESLYYNSSDVNQLVEVYRQIAEQISQASYQAQTINVTGNMTDDNILFSDSYIAFNYTPIINPFEYGEIELTRETERIGDMNGFNSTEEYIEGKYWIPEEVKVVDAKATSYSSQYWTDRVYVKTDDAWNRVYWLEDYGNEYQRLGDPYLVQIPVDLVEEGKDNFIRIGTGLTPSNATGGSEDDRVIYTMRIKGSVGYGDVFNSSDLAVEDARQRLVDATSSYVDIENENIQVQNETLRGIQWLWGPSLLKVMVWER